MATPEKKTGASLNRGGSQQVVATPWEFIHACEKRYGAITFDLAASPGNAKAPRYYTAAQNSLLQPWAPLTGTLWLNPEYEQADDFTYKCRCELRAPARAWRRILVLLPASIGSNWYAENVFGYARTVALNGRMKFVGHKDQYPKDLMLLVYGDFAGFEIWRWRGRALEVPTL